MKSWYWRSLVLLILVGAVGALNLVPAEAPKAGTATQIYLDLVPQSKGTLPGLLVGGVPPNGSAWHELYPAYCGTYTQTGYIDNGDGVISACDGISLNGVPYHITWAGPTYFVTCSTSPGGPPLREVVYEPVQPNPTGNPICEVWHEVHPNFCREIHIDSWLDNGNGVLDVCDIVDVQNDPSLPPGQVAYYHIDRIGCNIIIEPVETPAEPSTWSKIKSLFGF